MALGSAEMAQFVEHGFVRLPGAVPRELALTCQQELWAEIGYDAADPGTWVETLVRVSHMGTPAFQQAATRPVLHEAFDQLVGVGRWRPRVGLGTFPLRFPGPGPAQDAGWHLEAGYAGADRRWRVNLRSRGRGLLMLFLFSDVDTDDAPTLVRIGSHLDVPPFLEPAGDDGRDWLELCGEVVPATAHRPLAAVTGSPGDVYLCHPFLVHTGQAHRGRTPRFMAQPELQPTGYLELDGQDPTPVERAVLRGLGR